MADTLAQHHPGAQITALVLDPDGPAAEEPFATLTPFDLLGDSAELHRIGAIYTVQELAAAMKPLLLRHLAESVSSPALYLDPDVALFDSLPDTVTPLESAPAILAKSSPTPPDPPDGSGGAFDLGFIAVTHQARPFLEWWWRQSRRDSLISPLPHENFRTWFDAGLVHFPHGFLADPGVQVAHWNLHSRDVARGSRGYEVDGAPLRSFHFSGFSPSRPWILTGDGAPRVLLSERPVLREICEEYARRLSKAGWDGFGAEYGFGSTRGGLPLDAFMRRAYRTALLESESEQGPLPPNPFEDQGFVDWLNEPAGNGAPDRLTRYHLAVWRERPDLQAVFAKLDGTDGPGFLGWLDSIGASELSVPPVLRPRSPGKAGPMELRAGVNLGGFLDGALGLGEAARLVGEALGEAAVEIDHVPYGAIPGRRLHPFEPETGGGPFDINLLCVNPDLLPHFVATVEGRLTGRYTIGYWCWEVENLPLSVRGGIDLVDEVWVPSSFTAASIEAATEKPVWVCPLPVRPPDGSRSRPATIRTNPDLVTFLFSFDFMSTIERKNPLGVIEAFRRAFPRGDGAELVLKSINGHLTLPDLERVKLAAGAVPGIHVIDRFIAPEENAALIHACDCYVSLHRAEGFGLTMAEAMAAGKPVIATGYSGNTEFMDASNSLLVPWSYTLVSDGRGLYPAGSRWADPDLDEAARMMQRIAADPELRKRLGNRAAGDMRPRSPAAVGRKMAARLGEIRQEIASAPPSPIETAAQILASPPGTANAPRGGFRRHVRRGLMRLLRPYWHGQRELDKALFEAIQRLGGNKP